MQPILFQLGNYTIYSYGLLIALGALAAATYVAKEGGKEGLQRGKVVDLVFLAFVAAFVGGKAFLFLENPSYYASNPAMLVKERGFVFYGSFLFAVPTMLWFFRRNELQPRRMLDVMAVATCLVQVFGRIGCFMAGCCYGKPTDGVFGVTYTDPACYALPLGEPIHPVQVYEACYLLLVLVGLLALRRHASFQGQMFLVYLVTYATGRFVLESFRGDVARGLFFDGVLSHSQLIATTILVVAGVLWVRWSRRDPRLSLA